MTVSFRKENPTGFNCCDKFIILKLLSRWKGSIYKLIWPEYTLFISCYFSLSCLYRFYLSSGQQSFFILITKYADKYATYLPVSFVLGFYVSIIVKRWWEQFQALPWIDNLALMLSATMTGTTDQERLYRRTIIRHTCLAIIQTFALISPRVKRRFPTMEHLICAGFLLEHEKQSYEETVNYSAASNCGGGGNQHFFTYATNNVDLSRYPTFWIPLTWASTNVANARAQNSLRADAFIKPILDEIMKIKDKLSVLISYDWVSIPLVYTQVVTLAVYTYFFSCLMSRQWLPHAQQHLAGGGRPGFNDTGNHTTTHAGIGGTGSGNGNGGGGSFFESNSFYSNSDDHYNFNSKSTGGSSSSSSSNILEQLDLIFPFFTTLQFFFFMGWLKVAESLLNPFGDEDDDIELNWMIDRNFQVGYAIVDQMQFSHPKLVKDPHWDNIVPEAIPHTIGSWKYHEEPPENATTKMRISELEGQFLAKTKEKSEKAYQASLLPLRERWRRFFGKHFPRSTSCIGGGGGGGGGSGRRPSYSSPSDDEFEVSTSLLNTGRCAIIPLERSNTLKKRGNSIDDNVGGGGGGKSPLSLLPLPSTTTTSPPATPSATTATAAPVSFAITTDKLIASDTIVQML